MLKTPNLLLNLSFENTCNDVGGNGHNGTGTGIIYGNGKLNQTYNQAYIQNDTGRNALIGKDWNSTYYNDCLIDDLLLYNKPLSANDIKRIYLGMHPLNG